MKESVGGLLAGFPLALKIKKIYERGENIHGGYPTELGTISMPQNLPINELYAVEKRRPVYFEALNLGKVRSGREKDD